MVCMHAQFGPEYAMNIASQPRSVLKAIDRPKTVALDLADAPPPR